MHRNSQNASQKSSRNTSLIWTTAVKQLQVFYDKKNLTGHVWRHRIPLIHNIITFLLVQAIGKNITELFVHSGDAVLSQITLTTCYTSQHYNYRPCKRGSDVSGCETTLLFLIHCCGANTQLQPIGKTKFHRSDMWLLRFSYLETKMVYVSISVILCCKVARNVRTNNKINELLEKNFTGWKSFSLYLGSPL